MSELFENMEHMDIQAERQNTAKQRERADKAEERANTEQKRADKAIDLFINTCQEVGLSKETIVQKLSDTFQISTQMAQEWVEKQ